MGYTEVVNRMYECLDFGGDYNTGWFGILYAHILTSHAHRCMWRNRKKRITVF